MEQQRNEGSANLGQKTHSSPSDIGKHPHLNCPRCNSSNTKFCYYNNYSLTQPRYMCKDCCRYWTHGGTQRKLPIGGNGKKCPPKINPPAKKISSGKTSKPLPLAMPPPAMMGKKVYDESTFLPSTATMHAINRYGLDLSLLQARCLESLKSPKSGNQSQSPGNLFPAQENLMNQPISPWDQAGSSSFNALNQGPGDNPSPQ